jgi:hypothetical protein
MNQCTPSDKDVNQTTNKIRDVFGYVSVAGFAIITVYAIAKLTPVWLWSQDEEERRRSGMVDWQ